MTFLRNVQGNYSMIKKFAHNNQVLASLGPGEPGVVGLGKPTMKTWVE